MLSRWFPVFLVFAANQAQADDACTAEHAALGHCAPVAPEPHHREASRHVHHTAHGLLGGSHDHAARYAVSLGLIGGTYRSPLFEGAYQGAVLGARASLGRFGAALALPIYRLTRNGPAIEGVGDVMAHAHVTLISRGAVTAGAMMMASAPTGDGDRGLGMGHVMLMPEAWATWTPRGFAFAASAGYARALGGAAAHAEHGGGMWPLVDPMNASEITYGATAMLAITPRLGLGGRTLGAMPAGEGAHRLAAGGRVVCVIGRATIAGELLGGVLGDPFGVRGVVETSIRFE